MKKIFLLSLLVILSNIGFSQQTKFNRVDFEKLLEKNVKLFDKANTKEENEDVLRRFERLKNQAKEEWVPLYYSALTKTYLIGFDYSTEKKQEMLNTALTDLKQAKKINNNSEITTLIARVYMHIVELDKSLGRKYSGTIKQLLDESINQNTKNPRTFLMYGSFYFNYPAIVGGSKEKAKKSFDVAQKLYKLELKKDNKLSYMPHWGNKWNDNYLALYK